MRRRISVVIPCLDEAATLGPCLDALAAQDMPAERFEVLLVDGESSDGSRELAQAKGVHVLHDGSRGPAAARNVGVRAAAGEIVAFTDADCVPRADWLTQLAEVFVERPDVDGVAGALRLPRTTLLGRLEDNDAQLRYRGYITSNIAYRRDAIEALGGFDESLRCCEDYDLAWRMLDAGKRIVHDARPVVTHMPPEIAGSLRGYLHKQFWYARHDVPAHARALLRARMLPDARGGSASAAVGGIHALMGSAVTAGLVGAIALRRPRLAGLSLSALAGGPMRQTLQGVARLGGERGDGPRLAAIAAVRQVVRGAGTLAGLADLARPSRRRVLSAPGPSGPVTAPRLAPKVARTS